MTRAKMRRHRRHVNDLTETAVHEAGHVIANLHFGISFVDVVINPDGSGCVTAIDTPEPMNLSEATPFTIARYSGIAAERVMLGRETTDRNSEDYRTVWTFVRPLFRKEHRFDTFTDKMLNRAIRLIQLRRDAVSAVAAALLSHRRLTERQAKALAELRQ
jgi:ATP-dependent Zn protease